jgi:hypothetical protein
MSVLLAHPEIAAQRLDWLADDAVRFKPVSPCIFAKCREIFTKCREEASVTRLKLFGSQKLGWVSPYSKSREAMLP